MPIRAHRKIAGTLPGSASEPPAPSRARLRARQEEEAAAPPRDRLPVFFGGFARNSATDLRGEQVAAVAGAGGSAAASVRCDCGGEPSRAVAPGER